MEYSNKNQKAAKNRTISYGGIFKKGNVAYLILMNSKGKEVKIPISHRVADHILLHVAQISMPEPKVVERGNDEDVSS